MQLSKAGVELIAKFEGFREDAYMCPSRVLTIGLGYTNRSKTFREYWIKTRGHKLRRGDTISRKEAFDILPMVAQDVYGAAVMKHIKPKEQNHYDAAVSMCFNCGPGAAKWKWGKALARGDVKEAARLLRVTAVTAKGKRLKGLVRRRRAEADMLLIGSTNASSRPRAENNHSPSRLLKLGSKGPEVRTVQEWLSQLNYHTGGVDGRWGALTNTAVLSFQSEAGLAVDGKIRIGGDTWSKLSEKVAKGERRDISAERANGIPNSRIVEASDKSMGAGAAGVGATGLVALAGQFTETKGVVESFVTDNLGSFLEPQTIALGVLICAIGYMAYQNYNAKKARIEDHQTGRTV